jgi:hypothetical protein
MCKLLWVSALSLTLSCCVSKPVSTLEKQKGPNEVGVVPPEIVRAENVHIENGLKTVAVSNANGRYLLSCYIEALGCMTPAPGENYFLVNKNTRWKKLGATEFTTLAVVQDWTSTYNNAENIGLVPEGGGRGSGLGVYMLESWTSGR